MPHQRQRSKSRSLVLYGLLLEAYPRAYLRRHREELLQNFQDLERDSSSTTALWRLILKDLAVSLRSEILRSFLGQTALVFTILGLLLELAHERSGKHEPFIWSCFSGYVLGWFAGWFGFDWRMSVSSRFPSFVRSFGGQAAMLLCSMTIALATAAHFPDVQERLVLAFCYGTALAWVSGWWKSRRRMSL